MLNYEPKAEDGVSPASGASADPFAAAATGVLCSGASPTPE